MQKLKCFLYQNKVLVSTSQIYVIKSLHNLDLLQANYMLEKAFIQY